MTHVCENIGHPLYTGPNLVSIVLADDLAPYGARPSAATVLSVEQAMFSSKIFWLTHWGRVTHICVNNQNIIGSDNGLSPGWRQAII